MSRRLPFLALLAAAFALLAGPVLARCSQNVVELERLGIQVASLEGLPFAAGNSPSRAIITFLGHSSYQIDTPQGVRAITDYNGVNGFGRKPDIVTMNNAHSTHFTDDPEEGITYVLRGWPSEARRDRGQARRGPQGHEGVERADQRPRLGRQLGAHQRQLDLHLRHRRPLHRPSRPPASSPDQGASRRARPHRRADGADRRRLHHGHAADGRRHQADPAQDRAAHALLGPRPGQPLREPDGTSSTPSSSGPTGAPSRSCARSCPRSSP